MVNFIRGDHSFFNFFKGGLLKKSFGHPALVSLMFLSLTGCLLRQSDTNDQRDRADNLRKPVREPRRPRRFC